MYPSFHDDEKLLRLLSRGNILCEVRLPIAKAVLRMMCARLCVVCNELGKCDANLYGDSAKFPYENPAGGKVRLSIVFINTPSEQAFTLEVCGEQ